MDRCSPTWTTTAVPRRFGPGRPWSDFVECRVTEFGESHRNHKAVLAQSKTAFGVSDRTQFGDLKVPTAVDVPAERSYLPFPTAGIFTAARNLPVLCGRKTRPVGSDLTDTGHALIGASRRFAFVTQDVLS